MAEILEEYDPDERESPGGRPDKYPWVDWLDGRIWKIVQGIDFKAKMSVMQDHVRKIASQRGVKVSVYTHDPETLVIVPRKEMDDEVEDEEEKEEVEVGSEQ